MRLFFRLDSTASGLLKPTWSCGSSCFDDLNPFNIDCEPRLKDAIMADGLRLDIISCISRRTDGRLVVFPFSCMSFNRADDCEWLIKEGWLLLVLAAKFSIDDVADWEQFWDLVSKLLPSSTVESLLTLLFEVESTSLLTKVKTLIICLGTYEISDRRK